MKKLRKSDTIAAITIIVTIVALIANHAATGKPAKKQVEQVQAALNIRAASSIPGSIEISATAVVPNMIGDRHVWWYLEIRKSDGINGVVDAIPPKEYKGTAKHVPANTSTTFVFNETVRGLEDGHYQVFLELREDVPVVDENGGLISEHAGVIADSESVTVR